MATKHIFQKTHGKPFRLEACWAIVKDIAKWYHYVEGVKGRQHKGDTNNYPFDLNSENSGADECRDHPIDIHRQVQSTLVMMVHRLVNLKDLNVPMDVKRQKLENKRQSLIT